MTIFCGFRFNITFTNDCDAYCTFQRNTWTPFGTLNECLAEHVEVESPSDSLLKVETFGNPDDDFDFYSPESDEFEEDEDSYCYEINSFYIFQSPLCNFIPTGITNYFKNLTILVVAHSGLKSVTKGDLKPFKYLRGLYLDNNQLEFLEKNLFMFNPRLQAINFSNNKLKHISHDILDSLTHLSKADFLKNRSLDMEADGLEQIESLKIALKEKFEPKANKVFEGSDEILECCKALYETESEE